jgi:hypothetical protein
MFPYLLPLQLHLYKVKCPLSLKLSNGITDKTWGQGSIFLLYSLCIHFFLVLLFFMFLVLTLNTPATLQAQFPNVVGNIFLPPPRAQAAWLDAFSHTLQLYRKHWWLHAHYMNNHLGKSYHATQLDRFSDCAVHHFDKAFFQILL